MDAIGGRYGDGNVLPPQWRCSDSGGQRGRLVVGLHLVSLREDHAEFIAAEAPDNVTRPDILAQHSSNMAQRRVPRGMAVLVVDLLHVVDVEINDARRHAIAVGEGNHTGQLTHKRAPVGNRGQRIFVSEAFERGDPTARPSELVAQAVALSHEPGYPLAQFGAQRILENARNAERRTRIDAVSTLVARLAALMLVDARVGRV